MRSTFVLRWVLTVLAVACASSCSVSTRDPLPSWADGPAKRSVLQFVQQVTDRSTKDFVEPVDRVAVFDNDGTLWVEQPLYVQVLFAADQMKAVAAQHPEWKANPAFEKVITGGPEAILQLPGKDQFAVAFAVHAGQSTEQYAAAVARWLATHQHPRFHRPYTGLAYQPMIELMRYLRAKQFTVYSVTGGETGFARVVNEAAFGVERTQVIGTLLKSQFDGSTKPAQLTALPDLLMLDDGDGKPESIGNVIGRRPILAFGNSDGDLSMLTYTATGPGLRFAALVHHDDADREYAYDRTSAVGHLDKALDAAQQKGWAVVSMKSDWKQIFPGSEKTAH